MKGLIALSLVLALGLTGCSKPKPQIVVQSWWNVDYAKKACQSANEWLKANQEFISQVGCEKTVSCPQMTERSKACAADETGGARDFGAKLAARFAADPACATIHFEELANPADRPKEAEGVVRWQLMINFEPAAPQQVWTLTGPASQFLRSSGTSDDIAGKVCAAVTG